jgi:hypothetical protein
LISNETRSRFCRILLVVSVCLGSGCGGKSELRTPGLRVEEVEPWGLAAAAGIEAGDVVESWRSASGGGALADPLELLWIEYDAAPREEVTLLVRRGGELAERTLGDAGWEMTVRPALPAAVRALHERTRTSQGDTPAAWDQLERRVAAAVPAAAAWAAWRRGVAAASSSERSEEAGLAFRRACELSSGRPEIVALLHSEEGQTFWMAAQFEKSDAPTAAGGRRAALARLRRPPGLRVAGPRGGRAGGRPRSRRGAHRRLPQPARARP